ncbi:bifunctional non-homologous end joining protein LigD [Hamadaea flava]|uniref:Non-homologous end-joining DNA ligase n=1 Tax=Hamadaea flava TaxID=1742688 RepID=A0ABV8LFC9_9ACTN|nr:non-homologous end-joining DNA ligase [Hamadaea flava]MCP2326358.1 bifunctional non-homologous end joining protein LigD [Hamadaea flava]
MTRVEVDGRRIDLTNLDKALYPDGFTKAEIIDYYTRVAPLMLPHLADRQVTRIRYPSGAQAQGFFEKNAPAAKPSWVRVDGGLIVVDELATLVWLAHLAALELHTPQWQVANGPEHPDRIVFDLDPTEPAGLDECRAVAQALRDRLAVDGLTAYPKTSGRKGMQVTCPVTATAEQIMDYARELAGEFARAAPDAITDQMAKAGRPGKIFIDWSQNNPSKTTVCVYSLRAGDSPTVSTPITWDEVASGSFTAADFTPTRVLERISEYADLHEPLLSPGPALPGTRRRRPR